MNKILILLTILSLSSVFANMEERRRELLTVIDEELNEINRLNKQIGARKPAFLLRMAELYLEKARLLNEAENRKWLSLSPRERLRRDEKDFFKESKKNYINAQKMCYYMLKRFKNFKGKGEVYYILAFNAKEFQQPKRAGQFFKKALKFSSPGSETNIKAKLALAEMYYNQKDYRKAEKLYVSGLKGERKRWWTKDAYNLAWCYFRNGKGQKAIDLMNKVHALSGNDDFVDVSDMVERDLAYFYSATGQTKSAIGFYKKVGKNVSTNLLKVGRYLKSKGKFKKAEKALSKALDHSKDNRELAAIGVELLSLYDRFGQVRDHLKVSEVLYDLHKRGFLDQDQLDKLKYHVKNMSALLQRQVVAKTYKSMKKTRTRKAAYATRYFQLMSKLEGGKNYRSIFHAAETQFAINKFDRSADLYDEAYESARLAKDKKIMRLSLDGLMASLGGKGVPKKTQDKYLNKAYSLYLKENPRTKRADKIYQRLFSSYHEKGNVAQAEKTLEKYLFHFPKNYSQQEAMLARVMDLYRKDNNKAAISKWVSKINTGEVKVSKAYTEKLKEVLLSMQFEKVQKLSSDGDKVQALRGYVKIYKSKTSSKEAKRNAAYNIAVLYHELGDKNKVYRWLMIALNKMKAKDVKKFENSIFLMVTGLFDYRETAKAANVNELALTKLCRIGSQNKNSFFSNASALYLSDGRIEKAIELSRRGLKCRISKKLINQANLDILQEAAQQERWQYVKNMIDDLEREHDNQVDLIVPIAQLRDVLISRGRVKSAKRLDRKINVIYARAKSKRKTIPVEALDIVSTYKVDKVIDLARSIERVKLKFPEKTYNKRLKKKFDLLEKLTGKVIELFEVGSGKGIVQGYHTLVTAYEKLASEIKNFKPKGSKDYVTSFRRGMKTIAKPLLKKAGDYRQEAKNKIIKNKILSEYNYFFMSDRSFPVMPKFFSRNNGVLMDRGGRK